METFTPRLCSDCAARDSRRSALASKHQHILFWGGLRGAVALALALGLPPEVPLREQIITISFAVVAFSVFVQGLTIFPLQRRMGEIPSWAPFISGKQRRSDLTDRMNPLRARN
jgi:CPA1 family monovalent cation:H+ antiporter